MKLIVTILLLINISLGSCVSTFNYATLHKSLNRLKKSRTQKSHHKSHITKVAHHKVKSDRTKTEMSNLISKASHKSQAKIEPFTMIIILGAVAVTALMITKYVRYKRNQLAKKEKDENDRIKALLDNMEINYCSSVKLIQFSNRQFYLIERYRNLYIQFYHNQIEAGIKDSGCQCPKTPLVGNLPACGKTTKAYNECFLLESLGGTQKNVQDLLPLLLKKIEIINNQVCGTSTGRYLTDRNKEIKDKLKSIEDSEDNIWVSILNVTRDTLLDGYASVDDKKSFPKAPQNEWESFLLFVNGVKVDKGLPEFILSAIVSILVTIPTEASDKFIVSKLYPFLSSFVKYVKAKIAKNEAIKQQKYVEKAKENAKKARTDLFKASIEFFINFGAYLSFKILPKSLPYVKESLIVIKSLYDLGSSVREYKSINSNVAVFATKREIALVHQQNFYNYNKCFASFLTAEHYLNFYKKTFDTLIDMSKRIVQLNADSMKTNSEDDFKGLQEENKGAVKDFVKNVLCDENIQFCARNLHTKQLKEIGLDEEDIQKLTSEAIEGPYSDFAVGASDEEVGHYMVLGFEPIHKISDNNILLGCRRCSKDLYVSNVSVINESDKPSCYTPKDTVLTTTLRLDNEKMLFVESIGREKGLLSEIVVRRLKFDQNASLDSLKASKSRWDDVNKWYRYYHISTKQAITGFDKYYLVDKGEYNIMTEIEASTLQYKENLRYFKKTFYVHSNKSKSTGYELSAEKHEPTTITIDKYKWFFSLPQGTDVQADKENKAVQDFVIKKFNFMQVFSNRVKTLVTREFVEDPELKGGTSKIIGVLYTMQPFDEVRDVVREDPKEVIDTVNYICDQICSNYPNYIPKVTLSVSNGSTPSNTPPAMIPQSGFTPRTHTHCLYADDTTYNESVRFDTSESHALSDIISSKSTESNSFLQAMHIETVVKHETLNIIDDKFFVNDVIKKSTSLKENTIELTNLTFTRNESLKDCRYNIVKYFSNASFKQNMVDLLFSINCGSTFNGSSFLNKPVDPSLINNENRKRFASLDSNIFEFQLGDFDSNIQIVRSRHRKLLHRLNTDSYDNGFIKLKGYVLHPAISGKVMSSQEESFYIMVFIKPLPQSGYIPWADNFSKLTAENLEFFFNRNNIYGSVTKSYIEMTKSKTIISHKIHQQMNVFVSQFLNAAKIYAYMSESLLKLALLEHTEDFIEIKRADIEKFSFEKMESFNMMIPVRFNDETHNIYNNETNQVLYRNIDVVKDSEGKVIKFIQSANEIGPGIRRIYWIELIYCEKFCELNNNEAQMASFGFRPLESVIETPSANKARIVTIRVWTAIDYRIVQKRNNICNHCIELQHAFIDKIDPTPALVPEKA